MLTPPIEMSEEISSAHVSVGQAIQVSSRSIVAHNRYVDSFDTTESFWILFTLEQPPHQFQSICLDKGFSKELVARFDRLIFSHSDFSSLVWPDKVINAEINASLAFLGVSCLNSRLFSYTST